MRKPRDHSVSIAAALMVAATGARGRKWETSIPEEGHMTKSALAIFAAGTALMASTMVASAATSGTCSRLSDTEYAVSTPGQSQTADTINWTNADDGGRITLNLKKAGCAIVTFAGGADDPYGAGMLLRVVIDDSVPCSPDSTVFVANSTAFDDRSMTFVCDNIPADSHSVQVQFHPGFPQTVYLNGTTLTVHHN